jgi:nicotinate-nucleotide adenylyltransferase
VTAHAPWRPGRPIGILGGTFDPIHLGHLAIAEQTREALDLAGVLFVPAASPPHKLDRDVSAAAHRLAMVERAIAGNPWFRASRIELDRPGPSYAVDTVRALAAEAAREGREEPVFIISVEALRELPTWRDPEGILAACRLAVVPRLGADAPGRAWLRERFPGLEERFILLAEPTLGHSASAIRERVATGRSIRYLVPDPVAAYIQAQRMYVREM